VLVLCDDDLLYRVIHLALSECDLIRGRATAAHVPVQGEVGSGMAPDLIVLALGATPVEPLAALAHASLLDRVGRVPLLIVSNRWTQPDPTSSIYRLGFPFDVRELARAVHRILHRGQEGGSGCDVQACVSKGI
jgi:hypothetical protein